VRVDWDLADGFCRLRWEERGGPPVAPGARRGFGREVIEWAVAQAVGGEVSLEFHPEGVRWALRFPLPEKALAA
jgi:two-component sensor histidine kinase